MPYYKAASVSHIPPNTCLPVQVAGISVLVINLQNTFYAISATCPHEDISLHLGAIQGDCIKCPLHGSRFNIKTGVVQDDPAETDLQTYRVKISGSHILISIESGCDT